MLFDDSIEIYEEVEKKILHISKDSSDYKNDLLAPFRTFFFGFSFTNFGTILLRFIIYLLISFIVYAICLNFFRGIIPDEILALLFYPLTLFIASFFSLMAPPSDSTFLTLSKHRIEDIKKVIQLKCNKNGKKLKEDYLNGLKEHFQIIEKDASHRNTLLKSLLAGIYVIGIYLIGIVAKLPINGSFTLLSIIIFLFFYLLSESHNSLKDRVFSTIYSGLLEAKLELEDYEPEKEINLLEELKTPVSSVSNFIENAKEKNAKT